MKNEISLYRKPIEALIELHKKIKSEMTTPELKMYQQGEIDMLKAILVLFEEE